MDCYWKLTCFIFLLRYCPTIELNMEEKAEVATSLSQKMLDQLADACTTNMISFNDEFSKIVHSNLLQIFIKNQIPFQGWNNFNETKLNNISWREKNCNLYFIIIKNLKSLNKILINYEESWDYKGFIVIISDEMDQEDAKTAASIEILKLSSYVLLAGFSATGHLFIYATNTNDGHTLAFVDKNTIMDNFKPTTFSEIFNRQRANFGGNYLPIYSFHHPPAIFADTDEDGLLYNLAGIDIRVCEAVGLALNFKPKFIDVGPQLWGKIFPNKTYSGIIGKINRGEGFMGVANIYINIRRTPYISFTAPYDQEKACLLTVSPRPLPKWMSITLPFTAQVWMVFIGSIFLMTLLTPTLYRFVLSDEKSFLREISGGFLFIISAYSGKNIALPYNSAMRLLVGFTMLSTLVTAIYYSSKMTSLLTLTVTEEPLVSLRQIKEREIKMRGFGTYWYELIGESSNALVRSLEPLLSAYYDVYPLYNEVAKGELALIGNERNLKYVEKLTEAEGGGGSPVRPMMEDCLASFYIGAIMQKNSPYKAAVDTAMYRITAAGLIEKFFTEVLSIDHPSDKIKIDKKETDISSSDSIKEFQPLSFKHLQGLFLFISLGYVLASAVLCAEYVTSKIARYFK